MSNRRDKRKSKRLVNQLHPKFARLSEEFASEYLGLQASGELDTEKELELFERYNNNWKNFARYTINKYPQVSNDRDKRESILNRFEGFVHKFLDRKSGIELTDTKKVGVDKMKEALSKVGVNTQAKTVKGVQKRVDELDKEKQQELIRVLS